MTGQALGEEAPPPHSLTLETSGACNLECPMCPRAMGSPTNRPMASEVLERVRPALVHARHVQLHGLGEPLMSPVFWDLLRTLSRSETQFIEVNSNGLLMTEPNIDRLLDSPLQRVNVSLDAATPETYRKIRGAAFQKVVGNLETLVRQRERRRRRDFAIHINMTLMRENVEELCDFVRLGATLGVDGIDAWHLVQGEIAGNDPEWAIEHHGWTFRYRDQHLSTAPRTSNRCVRAALDLARHLNIAFEERPELWLPE